MIGALLLTAVSFSDLDSIVQAEMDRRKTPGMAVAVVRRGEVLLSKGFGVCDLEKGAPVTPQTAFEIGSITKVFTATGIMLLRREGKLQLDDRLGKHLPECGPVLAEVTLRELLTHTSGLKELATPFGKPLSPEESLQKAARVGPAGERRAYNNFCFQLLGAVLERVSGKPYGQFMAERIFQPLGMSRTALAPLIDGATGYSGYFGSPAKATLLQAGPLPGAGAIVSTLDDLLKWDAALRKGSLLTREEQTLMHTPHRLPSGPIPQGLGWSLLPDGSAAHNGLTAGFSSAVIRTPDDDPITVLILANLAHPQPLRPLALELIAAARKR